MVHTKNISIIKGQQNINTTTSTGVDDNDNADNADNADNNTVKKASLFF
jgi:hypothetical protein